LNKKWCGGIALLCGGNPENLRLNQQNMWWNRWGHWLNDKKQLQMVSFLDKTGHFTQKLRHISVTLKNFHYSNLFPSFAPHFRLFARCVIPR
jgi:hypothetical protein